MFECVKCGYQNKRRASECAQCTWPFSEDAWGSTSSKIKKITIDTGCVNAKGEDKSLNKLEEWASEGLVEIQRADVFMKELKGDDRLAKGKQIQPHPGLFTIRQSVLGGGDVLAGPDLTTYIEEILFPTAHTLTPNQENDIQHLSQHVRVGNDVFVTLNTKDFVKHGKQAALAERGIWVFTPSEIVDLLERLYGWP